MRATPSDEIFDLIYQKTQGVPAILEYLMTRMNTFIADHGLETIDSAFIKDIYKTQLVPLHEAVAALAVGDTRTYDDLYPISKLLMDKFDDDEGSSPQQAEKVDSEPPSSKVPDITENLSELDTEKEMSDLEALLPE